jgi:Acyl-CoA thioesterase N-terminal domain
MTSTSLSSRMLTGSWSTATAAAPSLPESASNASFSKPRSPLAASTASSSSSSFFTRQDCGTIKDSEYAVYTGTVNTIGPWSADFQHGGPIAALLHYHCLAYKQGDTMTHSLPSFSLSLLRPLPVDVPFKVTVRCHRASRAVQHLSCQAVQVESGRVLATASGMRVIRTHVHISDVMMSGVNSASQHIEEDRKIVDTVKQLGAAVSPANTTWHGLAQTFHSCGEWRFIFPSKWPWMLKGGFGGVPGSKEDLNALPPTVRRPALVQLVPRLPLLWQDCRSTENARLELAQFAVAVGDAGSGISGFLDIRHFNFANADYKVSMMRPPVGEWVAMSSQTRAEDVNKSGMAMAFTRMYDEQGMFASSSQTLIVRANKVFQRHHQSKL